MRQKDIHIGDVAVVLGLSGKLAERIAWVKTQLHYGWQ